jgi:WXXGXW repeat (2 copies)
MLIRIAGSVFFSSTLLWAAEQQPPMPPEEQPAGAEVLTRGPVNEAFDEPVTLQAEAGLVAPNEPPHHIEEVPPTDKPEGNDYVWVPGYWSWDADRTDYVWVSGCWRVAPPNMYWLPGYWTAVAGGWEWVAGFWSTVGAQAIDYLPAPPAPLQLEPPGPPPSPDRLWVPGCWYWSSGRYVHRPGYWLKSQPNWVWVPSHYHWSPRGYVFAEGHWDHAIERRGVLFAPVYFPPSVYARVGFSYAPTIAIDLGLLTVNLFAYPRYSHYYFGDYYDDAYLRIGIFPRFDCERIHTWYDPNYQYDRSRNRRTDPGWEEHQRQDYERRRADATLRPPRTYHEQEARIEKLPEPQRRAVALAGPVRAIAARQATPSKFEQINVEQRQKIASNGSQVRKFRDDRAKWETPAAAAPIPPRVSAPVPPPSNEHHGGATPPAESRGPAPAFAAPRPVAPTRPERVTIPQPPIVARPAAASDKSQKTPPPPSGERKHPVPPSKSDRKEKDPKKE